MALNLPKLNKVPKWALYASGGAIFAGGVIYIIRNRDAPPEDDSLDTDEGTTGSDAYYDPPGGGMGTQIVPPIYNMPDTSNLAQGTTDLADLYMGGITNLLDVFSQQASGMQDTIYASIRQGADIYGEGVQVGLGAIGGGGAPAVVGPAGGGTPTAPPITAPPACPGGYPLGAPPNCYRQETDRRQRDNGRSGGARKVWCNQVTIHRYQNGRTAVLPNEVKIRDGGC